MKLSFNLPYLSIQSFPEADLPSYTLITGVNGAGKTHLLEAILKERVQTDLTSNPKEDIRLFDWNSLVPNNTGEFQTTAIYSERDQILQWARQASDEQHETLIRWATRYNLPGKVKMNTLSLSRLTPEDLSRIVDESTNPIEAWEQLQGIANAALDKVKHNARKNAFISAKINELHRRLGPRILALRFTDFEDQPFGWGQVDIFQQSFAQLFLSYFELKRQNRLGRLDKEDGLRPSVEPVSDEAFVDQYGEPPWDFVNRILANARLDFEIDYPEHLTTTKFTPQLYKKSNGVELQFTQLSSGERILMSFALCLYYSQDKRQELKRPKLLLFDEIDAPLHPSMARQLVNTIQNSLVMDQGVKVILATHSPSTVAVTPEEAVYVMRPDEPGLHKVNKRQAIAVLTSEIPTLSINFSGRRQVFVESRSDAERYEKLFRFLSPRISSERSLSFLAVGRRKDEGEENSGCDQVKQIVSALVTSGNDSVFGLVDWDQKNTTKDRIIVLAEGKRYAIENCLLDPLLVGALTVRSDRQWGKEIGLAPDKMYSSFNTLTAEECQAVIDGVERKVLGLSDGDEFGERQTVEYVGGLSVQVSSSYLHMQGHELEDRVKEALPVLRQYHNQGELLLELIDPVIVELEDLVPVEILHAFETILEYEPGDPVSQ